MDLQELKKNWNEFAKEDALSAVCVTGSSWKNRRKWSPEEFFASGVSEVNALMAKIEQQIGLKFRHGKALDFGCGVGRLTRPLSNYFEEVSGVDISDSMLEQARKYDKTGRCKFYLNERDDLALFQNDSFDFILSLITSQHIEPHYSKNYLREFLRVLCPQGLVVFQVKDSRIDQGEEERKVFMASLRSRIYRLRKKYRKLDPLYRAQHRGPVMENHTLSGNEVNEIMQLNGGRIIHVDHPSKSKKWLHAWYFVTKDQSY